MRNRRDVSLHTFSCIRQQWATHLVVSVIFVPSVGDSALNCTIWPDESGNVGLYVGGFELSYPIVRSRTLVTVSPAMVFG